MRAFTDQEQFGLVRAIQIASEQKHLLSDREKKAIRAVTQWYNDFCAEQLKKNPQQQTWVI